ncbi:MAG TPA: thioredoxin domain-containing protein [Anaerolineae bacterium]|jgi:protein-disulfide isomerase|nr:thioredoxin domain-containing protein [Anaerolineae bacterium]
MAKRVKRKPREQARETNWWLIGGIIVVGVIVIFALLFLALQEPEATTLTQFCLDNPENCIFKGAADAPVSIVEVSDYGCSYCRDFNLETAGLLEDLYVTQGDVQWIVLPFALNATTLPAAAAAMCAADQGRFDEFHRRMFEIQGRPTAFTSDGFNLISGELGLDHAAFSSCLENAVYDSVIQDNIREASLAGVNSTPTFFVNDKKFSGNHPLTTFQDEIASALGTADAN